MSFSPRDHPYEAPQTEISGPNAPWEVPPGFVGKWGLALRLFVANLATIAPMVLTVWLPAYILIETLVARSANPEAPFAALPLETVVELFFGPLISGALIWVLAERMEGRRASYRSAIGVGLQNWGRLFGARFFASWIILIGLIALIVPGIVFAVRFSLIDEAVVLDGEGVHASRRRSETLVGSNGWEILLSGTLYYLFMIAIALGLGVILPEVPGLDTFWGNIGLQCILSVVAMLIPCVIFLYYWEARTREIAAELEHKFDPDRPNQRYDLDRDFGTAGKPGVNETDQSAK